MLVESRSELRESQRIGLAIIGAGIGGLAAALALQKSKHFPVVFERAPELKEIGAGLLLSPNAVAALEYLGLRREVEKNSRIIREWRILNRRGKCLQRIRPIRAGFPALSLHRAELQSILLRNLAPDTVRLGAQLTDYKVEDNGIRLAFASGESACAAALIGADGLRSAVRSIRFGRESLCYCGYLGWRGVAQWIPPEYAGEHLSESWGEGKRFGISPLGNGCCYWYATANRPENAASNSCDSREVLLAQFRQWHHPIPELIEATPDDNLLVHAIYDRPPRQGWTQGAVTLLGDAAHPMTPNLGQGACCALEDACVLARLVECCATVEDAFVKYERVRVRRTDVIQKTSRWLGNVIQLESPISTGLRDACLRLTPDFCANLSMRWLFGFKP